MGRDFFTQYFIHVFIHYLIFIFPFIWFFCERTFSMRYIYCDTPQLWSLLFFIASDNHVAPVLCQTFTRTQTYYDFTFRNKLILPICPGGGVVIPQFLEQPGRLWPKPDTSVRHINTRRIWKHNAIFCYKNHKLCKSETCRSQFILDCNNSTMYSHLNHKTRPISQIIWYACVSVTSFSI